MNCTVCDCTIRGRRAARKSPFCSAACAAEYDLGLEVSPKFKVRYIRLEDIETRRTEILCNDPVLTRQD